MTLDSYTEAKNGFLAGDFSSEGFFAKNNCVLEYGYCKFLSGDLDAAGKAFFSISDNDFRADWARKLIKIIQGQLAFLPSYFQLRNFLEIDLNLLIKAGQAQFVENIINASDLFYSINPESYKFIARVMYNNEFFDVALHYLNKAKDKFYFDPEMHFMLACCHLKNGQNTLAKIAVENCLTIMPEYLPAKNLLKKI